MHVSDSTHVFFLKCAFTELIHSIVRHRAHGGISRRKVIGFSPLQGSLSWNSKTIGQPMTKEKDTRHHASYRTSVWGCCGSVCERSAVAQVRIFSRGRKSKQAESL